MSSKELWKTISAIHSSRDTSSETTIVNAPSEQPTEPQAGGKLKFLEGMRGVAALYVVLGHLCSMADPSILIGRPDPSPQWMRSFTSCFAYGHVAVAIFIVISGFSLQLSLFTSGSGQVDDVRRFYARRAQRILPTYYACLVISLIVARLVTPTLVHRYGEPFPMYLPADRWTFLWHLLMVHNWSPTWMYKINGVLWSIAIESQLYVVFPLLVMGIWKLGRSWTLLLTTTVAIVWLNAVPDAPKLYPWYLPLFVIGMIASHLAYRPNLKLGVLPRPAFIVAVAAGLLGVWTCGHGKNMPIQDAWFALAAAAGMYGMTVSANTLPGRLFGAGWVTFIGGYSYSLYLMHHPIEQVLYLFKPVGWTGPTALLYQFAVGLPVILVASWLFSLVFERPFLPKKDPRRSDNPIPNLHLAAHRTTDPA